MKIDNLVIMEEKENNKKLDEFKNNNSKMKIGILGGTFDPIHYAHLATAEFIRDKYSLDKIFFIPTGNPPHKLGIKTDKYDRYNMVLLATSSNKNFLVSNVEIERNERTYTIDTLKYLKETYKNTEIYFITGADAICDIEKWKDVENIFDLATFIAAARPGINQLVAQEKIEQLIKKYKANIISVYVPSLDISSTYIREQLKDGRSVRYLVPETVENYLYKNKLYEQGDE